MHSRFLLTLPAGRRSASKNVRYLKLARERRLREARCVCVGVGLRPGRGLTGDLAARKKASSAPAPPPPRGRCWPAGSGSYICIRSCPAASILAVPSAGQRQEQGRPLPIPTHLGLEQGQRGHSHRGYGEHSTVVTSRFYPTTAKPASAKQSRCPPGGIVTIQ
jgi:hypothetical protein